MSQAVDQGQCEHCQRRFGYDLVHHGFNDSAFAYPTRVATPPFWMLGSGTFPKRLDFALMAQFRSSRSLGYCPVGVEVVSKLMRLRAALTAMKLSRPKLQKAGSRKTRREHQKGSAGKIHGLAFIQSSSSINPLETIGASTWVSLRETGRILRPRG